MSDQRQIGTPPRQLAMSRLLDETANGGGRAICHALQGAKSKLAGKVVHAQVVHRGPHLALKIRSVKNFDCLPLASHACLG